ncbi:MAG: translation initiation factor 2 [Thermoanaerobacteraceae bacterium]|nr:translation initiation factor 2 [Thermoanaerobacteraceae bacterium]
MVKESKEALKKRISILEEKVEHLRVSRRVLMNLIEKLEKEKKQEFERLERINRKLQQSNSRYAKDLILKNKKIVELEEQVKKMS